MLRTIKKGLNVTGDIIDFVSLQTIEPNAVKWRNGQPDSCTIDKHSPVMSIALEIRGLVNIASGTTTFDDRGPLRMIERLMLKLGNHDRVSIAGTDVDLLHRVFTENPPDIANPAGTAGSREFYGYVELPIDPGSYAALLDASKANSFSLHVDGADAGDWVKSNANNTEIEIDIQPVVFVLDGIKRGHFGGQEQEGAIQYLRTYHQANEENYTNSGTITYELDEYQLYHGVIIESLLDDTRSDELIEAISLEKGNNTLWKHNAERIRSINKDKYKRAWDGIKGVYSIPMMKTPYHADHMQKTDAQTTMKLRIWTKAPAGEKKLRFIESYFEGGPAGYGLRTQKV